MTYGLLSSKTGSTQRMKRARLHIGFIGCGRATSQLHLPALAKVATAEVRSLADIDKTRLDQVGRRFGVKRRHTDYRLLMEDPEIDLVAVCVPTHLHAEVSVAALEAGKHLFLEKPIATNLSECDRILSGAASTEAAKTVGFNLRFHRLVDLAFQVLQEGKLGRIDSVRSQWSSPMGAAGNYPAWRRSRKAGGGALFEIGTHHFDLFRFLLQTEIDEVWVMSRMAEETERTASVIARTTDGVVINSLFTESSAASNGFEVFGERGKLSVSLYRVDGLEFAAINSVEGGIKPRLKRFVRFLSEFPRSVSILRHGGDYLMSYRREWEALIESIRRGTDPAVTLEDGKRALEITLAAVESSSTGRPVQVVRT